MRHWPLWPSLNLRSGMHTFRSPVTTPFSAINSTMRTGTAKVRKASGSVYNKTHTCRNPPAVGCCRGDDDEGGGGRDSTGGAHWATTAVPLTVPVMNAAMSGLPKFSDTGWYPRARCSWPADGWPRCRFFDAAVRSSSSSLRAAAAWGKNVHACACVREKKTIGKGLAQERFASSYLLLLKSKTGSGA